MTRHLATSARARVSPPALRPVPPLVLTKRVIVTARPSRQSRPAPPLVSPHLPPFTRAWADLAALTCWALGRSHVASRSRRTSRRVVSIILSDSPCPNQFDDAVGGATRPSRGAVDRSRHVEPALLPKLRARFAEFPRTLRSARS